MAAKSSGCAPEAGAAGSCPPSCCLPQAGSSCGASTNTKSARSFSFRRSAWVRPWQAGHGQGRARVPAWKANVRGGRAGSKRRLLAGGNQHASAALTNMSRRLPQSCVPTGGSREGRECAAAGWAAAAGLRQQGCPVERMQLLARQGGAFLARANPGAGVAAGPSLLQLRPGGAGRGRKLSVTVNRDTLVCGPCGGGMAAAASQAARGWQRQCLGLGALPAEIRSTHSPTTIVPHLAWQSPAAAPNPGSCNRAGFRATAYSGSIGNPQCVTHGSPSARTARASCSGCRLHRGELSAPHTVL